MIAADYPAYETLADLAAAADLVVTVTIGDWHYDVSRPLDSDETDPVRNPQAGVESSAEDPGIPITVYAARVDAVHRGAATVGDVIEIGIIGGVLGGIRYESNVTQLVPGRSYALFLATTAARPASVVGGDRGVFLASGREYAAIAADGLGLTATDLAALS